MSKLNGMRVALDLDALHQLCELCIRSIETQQEKEAREAQRKLCGSGVEAGEVPLQALHKGAHRHAESLATRCG